MHSVSSFERRQWVDIETDIEDFSTFCLQSRIRSSQDEFMNRSIILTWMVVFRTKFCAVLLLGFYETCLIWLRARALISFAIFPSWSLPLQSRGRSWRLHYRHEKDTTCSLMKVRKKNVKLVRTSIMRTLRSLVVANTVFPRSRYKCTTLGEETMFSKLSVKSKSKLLSDDIVVVEMRQDEWFPIKKKKRIRSTTWAFPGRNHTFGTRKT